MEKIYVSTRDQNRKMTLNKPFWKELPKMAVFMYGRTLIRYR